METSRTLAPHHTLYDTLTQTTVNRLLLFALCTFFSRIGGDSEEMLKKKTEHT